jgi:hypothetical protein
VCACVFLQVAWSWSKRVSPLGRGLALWLPGFDMLTLGLACCMELELGPWDQIYICIFFIRVVHT